MLRTLGENDTGVPARSPSGEKGDLDVPNQPKTGRDEAGARSDKSDLMSRLWSIIDMTTSQPPHHTCSSMLTKHAQPAMFSGRRPRFSGTRRASFALSVRSNRRYSQVGRRMFSRPNI
jgi:hypothetical protein